MQAGCRIPWHDADQQKHWLPCRLLSCKLATVLFLFTLAMQSFVAEGGPNLTPGEIQAIRLHLEDKIAVEDSVVKQRLNRERMYEDKKKSEEWPAQIQEYSFSSEATERQYRPESVGQARLRFRLRDTSMESVESLASAKLHVAPQYVRQFWPSHLENEPLLNVIVEGLFSSAPDDDLGAYTKVEVLDSELFLNGDNDFCELDVLPAVKRWVESGHAGSGVISGELRLRVEAGPKPVDEDGSLKELLSRTQNDLRKDSDAEPFLQVTFVDKDDKNPSRSQRERRQTNSQRVDPGICAVRQIMVNAAEIGWQDFLIHPKKFNMTYCAGDCTFPFQIERRERNELPKNRTHRAVRSGSTTHHAIVQSLLHMAYYSKNEGKRDERINVPPSCCAPLIYETEDMLYLTYDAEVITRPFTDLKVIECTCI